MRLLRWLLLRRGRPPQQHDSEDAVARHEAERQLEQAQNATPTMERAARRLAELPADELLKRVNRAFGPGGT